MIAVQEPQTADEVKALAMVAHRRRMGWVNGVVHVDTPAPPPEEIPDVITVEALAAACFVPIAHSDDEDAAGMPTIAQITREISRLSRLHPVEIKADTRHQKPVMARQSCWWLAKRYTYTTTTKLGRMFGNRDHTTILHGLKSINRVLGDRVIELDGLTWREASELLWSIVGNHKKANPRETVKIP